MSFCLWSWFNAFVFLVISREAKDLGSLSRKDAIIPTSCHSPSTRPVRQVLEELHYIKVSVCTHLSMQQEPNKILANCFFSFLLAHWADCTACLQNFSTNVISWTWNTFKYFVDCILAFFSVFVCHSRTSWRAARAARTCRKEHVRNLEWSEPITAISDNDARKVCHKTRRDSNKSSIVTLFRSTWPCLRFSTNRRLWIPALEGADTALEFWILPKFICV